MKVEINKEEKEAIDWSKPQLVISKITPQTVVWITTGCHEEDTFEGVNLYTGEHFLIWNKEPFELFKGSITLSND